jgi:uncharacterized RDD family membrane protein YckC
MSDTSQVQGWWLASDGKWYAPELHPSFLSTLPPPPVAFVPYPPGYGPPPSVVASMGVPGSAGSMGAGAGVAVADRIDGTLDLALAPWWKRLVAFVIDGALAAVPYSIVIALIAALNANQVTYTSPGAPPSPTPWWGSVIGGVLGVLLATVPYMLYVAACNGSRRGQTIGKMAMHIAVRDSRTGDRIGLGRGVGRYLMTYLFWALLIAPGVLDALSPLWDGRRQTWHDKVARSVVVDLGP